MQLFYTPDITPPEHTLDEQESRHCVKVLRLVPGDRLNLTDGRGTLYTAVVRDADPRRCRVEVVDAAYEYGRRAYSLTMAVAPTKNIERYEWFLEKATEVGCDVFVPLECARSERRVIKPEREEKVITSAVKQSLKAYHPQLVSMTRFADLVARPFGGVKLIAHCAEPLFQRRFMSELAAPGEDILVLIGPEGDFSPDEVRLAVDHGFRELTLGDARLRTETAALTAVVEAAMINR